MTEFLLALAGFLVSHAVPAMRPVREHLVRSLGERPYLILYSAVSVAVLWWLATAYGRAAYVELWPFALWTRWVPVIAMPFACVLLAGGLMSPNPLSLGRGARGFDPARPGIVAVTRHPVLWALALWAGAHVVPNGDLASVLLFGLLSVLSLAGTAGLDAKRRRALGRERWEELAASTSNVPFAAIASGRARFDRAFLGPAAAIGLALYLVLLAAHAAVIGVSPLPW